MAAIPGLASTGRDTRTRMPDPPSRWTAPPRAAIRSRMPVMPAPSGPEPPSPSSATSRTMLDPSIPIRMVACRAPAWRTTFVTDSRSANAIADSYAIGSGWEIGLDRGFDPGGIERTPRAVELPTQSLGPVADHRGADLGKRLAADALHVPHLLASTRRIALRQARGELGFHDDQRQRVTKEVMQVARDALAFSERREPLDLLVGAAQATLRTLALGIEDVRGAGHDREDERRRQTSGTATGRGRSR